MSIKLQLTSWMKLLLPYALFVAVATAFIAHRPALEWRAVRRLPMNHRIQSSDLVAPPSATQFGVYMRSKRAFEGRYLTRAVYAGEPITPADLKDRPIIETSENVCLDWLSLGNIGLLPSSLEPGTIVNLCAAAEKRSPGSRESQPCVASRIIAVQCERDDSSCIVIVGTNTTDRRSLAVAQNFQGLFIRLLKQEGEN